jgi:hypothetical protein
MRSGEYSKWALGQSLVVRGEPGVDKTTIALRRPHLRHTDYDSADLGSQ